MKQLFKIFIAFMMVAGLWAQDLNDYFRIAAENNPGLKATYLNVEIALQKAARVAALPDPTLSFAYFISPVETRVGPQRAKASLTQMFPWFGTLKAKRDAAALNADAAYQTFINAKQTLYADLAAAYYPLLEREEQAAAQEKIIENLKSLKTLAETRVASGTGSMVNVLRINRMLESGETKLNILNDKKKPLEAAFNAILNRDLQTPVVTGDDLNDLPDFAAPSVEDVFDSHPVLEALDLKIRAKAFEEKAAKRAGLPRFGLGLDYVVVGERTDMVVAESGKDVIMPMLSVSLPLARKKYNADVKTVRTQQEQLELGRTAAENSLRTAYAKADFDWTSLHDKLEMVQSQIATTRQISTLLLTQFSQSGGDVDDLLKSWLELLAFEEQLATIRSDIHVSYAKLLALTARVNIEG